MLLRIIHAGFWGNDVLPASDPSEGGSPTVREGVVSEEKPNNAVNDHLRHAVLAFCCVVFIVSSHGTALAQEMVPPQKANSRPAETGPAPEPFDKASVEQMGKQCVTLHTAEGAIEIEMLAEAATENVRNFLNLVATGVLDTTSFSRVVRGFIIQGGNISTRESLTNEIVKRARRTVADEPNAVKHLRGIVSTARTDQPNSATTHFFILTGDGPHLDGTFSAFGRVRTGMDVADKIEATTVEGERPEKPVRLNRAVAAPCAPFASP